MVQYDVAAQWWNSSSKKKIIINKILYFWKLWIDSLLAMSSSQFIMQLIFPPPLMHAAALLQGWWCIDSCPSTGLSFCLLLFELQYPSHLFSLNFIKSSLRCRKDISPQKLDRWVFKSGILLIHLEKIWSTHRGTAQHSGTAAAEHLSVPLRRIAPCFHPLHPPHDKKAPYLSLFPYQWFTHSRWRTQNKLSVRIQLKWF